MDLLAALKGKPLGVNQEKTIEESTESEVTPTGHSDSHGGACWVLSGAHVAHQSGSK